MFKKDFKYNLIWLIWGNIDHVNDQCSFVLKILLLTQFGVADYEYVVIFLQVMYFLSYFMIKILQTANKAQM